MQSRIFAWALLAAVPAMNGAFADVTVPLRLISAPAVSPDGKSMAFEWDQDLWTASTDGGEAKRVVRNPARDAYPRFSPDGKRIVFSSDRSGSFQVFSVPATGGETLQHTWHTEGNELECLSPDGGRAIVRGIRERSGFRATRLMEIDLTADRRERRLFDATAHSAAWSPDGTRVLFCRGGEQLYRKGYRGSRASQIWLYQIKDRSFECKVADGAEARSPLWRPDGKSFYFVSNRTGTANLWLQEGGSTFKQMTSFRDDGVITPDLSADGSTFVFRRGLDVFRFKPGTDKEPVVLGLWTREALPAVSEQTRRITGTLSADFTKDLKQVVFAASGELWRIDGPGQAAARLTETAAAEEDVRFSPAGEWLYFLRDSGIDANYFRARFENGKLRDEQPVTRGARSKCRLAPSPDGSAIAWVEGTGDLFCAKADGSEPRLVFKCWDKPTFDWSPDGRWLALAAEDRESNRDIWLASADGGREPVDLTCHPAFDGSPKWSPDGRWLVFSSRRGASGKSQLWRIGLKPDLSAGKPVMISTKGIEPTRVVWAADSKTIWFQSAAASSRKLYSIGVDGGGMRTVTAQRGIPIRMAGDGNFLWRVDRTPEILTSTGAVGFPIAAELTQPRGETLTLGFRRIWRTLGECFHDEKLNGRDWEAMRLKYESAAGAARDSRQFDRVVSQLFGELNASHLTFLRKPWPEEIRKPPSEDKTAHPGVVFRDDGAADGPLLISRVITGSPAAHLPEAPKAGDAFVRIAGEPVSSASPLHRFFNGADNRPLPVVLRDADGRERVIELRCISYRKARSLDRQEREATASKRVADKNPKAAYLAVPNMNRDTLEDLQVRIYQSSLKSEGLILDLRNNGGGREADRMLSLFCQPVHSVTVPRDGPAGYPIDRRPATAWNKPLVVLCNQNTFSNAEIFCHAVKQTNRAPLVGITTAGGVISASKTVIPDTGELQVPFRGWFHAGTGENLDMNGATPDFAVDLAPGDEDAMRDPQLDKALEVLGQR
jgi:tricorn protease